MNQYKLQREYASISWESLDEIIRNDSQQSIKKYQKLINEMPHWIWETNANMKIVYSNFYVSEITGYETAEVIGFSISKLLFPHEFNGVNFDYLQNKLIGSKKQRVTLNHRIRHRNQSIRHLKTVIMATLNGNNKIIGLQGVTHDLSSQIIAEQALIESKSKLKHILSNLSEIVFMVNSDGAITFISPAVERFLGMKPDEILGKAGIEILTSLQPDNADLLIEKFKQAVNNKQDEFNYETKITINGKQCVFDIFMKIIYGLTGNFNSTTGVIRDITKKRRAEADMHAAFNGAIEAIAAIVEQRDIYTHGHQHNVAELSVAIAKKIGLNSYRTEGLRIAAVLHDVGKVSIPTEILNRPSELSQTERRIIEMHPKLGSNIVREIPFPWNVARFVEEHHERIDGSGYPKALTGNQISLEAKIIGVADTFDSITNHRPFRPAKKIEAAIKIIEKDRSIKFDDDVVDAIMALYRMGTFDSSDTKIDNNKFL